MRPTTKSKDLLSLENKDYPLESTLLVCQNASKCQIPRPSACLGKLVTSSAPKSQVLGKVKDFLGVMAEANTRLQHDAKEKSSADYDIEALTGDEKEYIEMDLVLGVADLHTPEAVAAAESAMAGTQTVIPLDATCSSGSDTETSEDDDDGGNGIDKACSSDKLENTTQDKDSISNNGHPKKRRKIIEFL